MAVVKTVRQFEHTLIHQGKMHRITDASAALANGASMGLVFWTGDEDLHLAFGIAAGGAGRVIFYEDPTVTASTLCLATCAMNRAEAAGASMSASFGHTPAFTVASASILSNEIIPGTTGGNKTGGTVRTSGEWILAPSTKYIVATCNLSGGAAGFSIAAEVYEH